MSSGPILLVLPIGISLSVSSKLRMYLIVAVNKTIIRHIILVVSSVPHARHEQVACVRMLVFKDGEAVVDVTI